MSDGGADTSPVSALPKLAAASPAEGDGRLARSAGLDALTGLPDRLAVAERLREAMDRARGGAGLVLLSIDLDDFKLVNDGLGHAAGDEVLRQLAERLDNVRRPCDVVARQGGDEFMMLVELESGADVGAAAASLGRRIADVLETPFRIGGAEFRIGASVGAAVYPGPAPDAETLHRHADSAMYEAKASGGGFAAFRAERPDPLARLATAAALRRGLVEGSMTVEYQPIYRLPSREIVGLEALSRWWDPARGPISPAEFIPVAERTGVINALGDWALEQLCSDAQAWDAQGLHPNFGFNVSPRQLQRPGFAADFARTVQRHGVDPSRIVVELTETGWTLELARTLPILDELTEAGFVLALDDFGAGYSSLSTLRTLPVKIIKIDRAFMTGLPDDPQTVAIIDAILALANACNCDVVVEGVETEAQLDFLTQRSVRLVQGFVLARPQPRQAITEMLQAQLVPTRRAGGLKAPEPGYRAPVVPDSRLPGLTG